MNPDRVIAGPLLDLGAETTAFAGIFSPRSSVGRAKRGVTAQFLEHADEYHRNYLNVDYWCFLLHNALAAVGDIGNPGTILDIGSGSGNSVIPLLRRFVDAQIVATDISPQLLAILKDFLDSDGTVDRVALICVDAAEAEYRPEVFDLAVGAAILHHVMEPERVLASCHRALKPGCWALFFEPFEAGNTLVKLTYQRILAQATAAQREIDAMLLLERMVADYTMRQRPKSDPIFREIDDKWMFTRTYFERIKTDQGWDELIVYPLNISPTFLRTQAEVHLRLGAQLQPTEQKDWAWAVIDETDAAVSGGFAREWAPEAAVLLRKRQRPDRRVRRSRVTMSSDRILQDQIDYYRARAGEYDEWWFRQGRYDRGDEFNARWHEETRAVERALDDWLARRKPRKVLELACGTGLFTHRIARQAGRVTAVDASPEVIAINRARVARPMCTTSRRTCSVATATRRTLRVVFFSFWLSHVPDRCFASFWAGVRDALAPDGAAYVIDSAFDPTSTAKNHDLPGREAGVVTRKLNDGREFRIVKIFWEPQSLAARLETLDWSAALAQPPNYFIHGEARPHHTTIDGAGQSLPS
jgi:demethylmenaquinone methyltransferase/2-methoxy-6-polyprenyl-1,4-benzoquinol methylase